VDVGGHFIVEDSICWHGVKLGPQPGPYEGVETFLGTDDRFEMDRRQEGIVITSLVMDGLHGVDAEPGFVRPNCLVGDGFKFRICCLQVVRDAEIQARRTVLVRLKPDTTALRKAL